MVMHWCKLSPFHGDVEEFFSQMPESKTLKELALQEEVKNILLCNNFKQKESTMSKSAIFMAQFRDVFPPGIELKDWIEHRLQDDIDVTIGQQTYPLPPQVTFTLKHMDDWTTEDRFNLKTQLQEEWFATLPEREFAPKEEELLDALVDYLTSCDRQVAKVNEVLFDLRVREARSNFLPLVVPIKRWIEQRIGEEIQVAFLCETLQIALGLPGALDSQETQEWLLKRKQKKPPEASMHSQMAKEAKRARLK
eukprot:TRINITY_DN8089_c0_g1_i3.p1 TRINITY_DN8089_c0_g1~~TRINITY_DN8089_c0_g1_i3.p1  ORF type:complete len:251 (-),score=44.97 TRINITY_DN8089_c0_g1_i3:213-965(-)